MQLCNVRILAVVAYSILQFERCSCAKLWRAQRNPPICGLDTASLIHGRRTLQLGDDSPLAMATSCLKHGCLRVAARFSCCVSGCISMLEPNALAGIFRAAYTCSPRPNVPSVALARSPGRDLQALNMPSRRPWKEFTIQFVLNEWLHHITWGIRFARRFCLCLQCLQCLQCLLPILWLCAASLRGRGHTPTRGQQHTTEMQKKRIAQGTSMGHASDRDKQTTSCRIEQHPRPLAEKNRPCPPPKRLIPYVPTARGLG